MSKELDEQSLLAAYEGRADLQRAIQNAAAAGPQYVELFNYISEHIISLLSAHSPNQQESKKRKLDQSQSSKSSHTTSCDSQSKTQNVNKDENVLIEAKGISFILPQRKKFTLCFTDHHIYARSAEEQVPGTKIAWKDVEYIFLLPIPEKAQVQHGFLIFPFNSGSPSPPKVAPSNGTVLAPPGPIVFTVSSATAPKQETIFGSLSHEISAVSDDYITLFSWVLKSCFKTAGISTQIITADEKLFCSAQKQLHRPNEKAVWVKAFRGSKEGYLFFLTSGILWTFKKPLLFLPHSKISAVSFTSVLSRTFNLNIEISVEDTNGETSEEIEFTMLDQEDFENINRYINRYGLQDRSMTEQRKARRLNINAIKDENGNVTSLEASELIKAGLSEEAASNGIGFDNQEMLDEDEDEDGEDYDPGSEGESEGSGSSSDEDEQSGAEDNAINAEDSDEVTGSNE